MLHSPGYLSFCAYQGFFSPSLRKKYSASLTAACERASAALRSGAKADEAVRIAIACLEDDATTNAGTGANLTMDGVVECDACIMDGRLGDSGGVCSILLRRSAPCNAARRSLNRVPPQLHLDCWRFFYGEENVFL